MVKKTNKNEECKALLDLNKCGHFRNVPKLEHHPSLGASGEKAVWDIEDLLKLGKGVRGCPYFAARTLAEKSDIVFCPYNYIVDPVIRKVICPSWFRCFPFSVFA